MATKIQIRRGTAALWNSSNPTLAQGEFGYEIDTNNLKIGDGLIAWNDLDYFVNEENFTYESIDFDLTIPYNMQMVVYGGFIMESDLTLEGSLILE